MPFTEDELKALRLLFREELQTEICPFRNEVERRFSEVATQIDLYQRDEKREQEYLFIQEQIRRLESRFA